MLHILKSTVHLYIAVGRVENGQNITPFREVSIFFFLQDAQKSALQLAKSSLKITDVGKKKKNPTSSILISNHLCTVSSSSLISPLPLILSEHRLCKVSVLICQCQGSSGSRLTGVRDAFGKSVSNDVFLTFFFLQY